MPETAVLWIRDGVLIDRMPVNAVAFAVASLDFADQSIAGQADLTALVDFAFATSGISCMDKMLKFNSERNPLIIDVPAAADYYNKLSSAAAADCSYIDGISQLVKKLDEQGIRNFITSAVDQNVLDDWSKTPQAAAVVPHLTEILGRRADTFTKGRDHFHHVRSVYGIDRILYVADAVSEIRTAARFASEFDIFSIGFAHLITDGAVEAALERTLAIRKHVFGKDPASLGPLDSSKLQLPGESALVAALQDAGASSVVSGHAGDIVSKLDACMAVAFVAA